jgi:hypothetical protein
MVDGDDTKIQRVLDDARTEIVRLNPYRALEYLRSIHSAIDSRRGATVWAEYQLLFADAYAAQGSSGAETYFEEALERAQEIIDPNVSLCLQMRVYEDFAKFLASVEHRRS